MLLVRKVTLTFSSNVIGDSKNETNFLHNLLSTNRQISRPLQAFW